jgi:hypothetical protein
MKKEKSYGKLLEELQFATKEDFHEKSPVILTENDIPFLSDIFNFLNNKDKDILYLIFISGKTQTDLVKILNRSQPSLSYDIKKIKNRIKFICYLHSQFSIFMDWLERADEHFTPEEIMILTLMYYTTSFSQSSSVSRQKPTKIRYIFDKALQKMKKVDEPMFHFFKNIRKNLNIIRRMYLKVQNYWNDDF